MTQAYITARNYTSKFDQKEIWRVFICGLGRDADDKCRFIATPLKAMRYMYLLKKWYGFQISRNSVDELKAALAREREN